MSGPPATPPIPPTRQPFVDKGRQRTPAQQTIADRTWTAAQVTPAPGNPTVTTQSVAARLVWNGAAIAFLAGGLLMVLLGLIVLLQAQNIFVDILFGSVLTSGIGWLAALVVTRVH